MLFSQRAWFSSSCGRPACCLKLQLSVWTYQDPIRRVATKVVVPPSLLARVRLMQKRKIKTKTKSLPMLHLRRTKPLKKIRKKMGL